MNARARRMTGFPTSSNSPHKLQSIANVSVCPAKIPSLDQTGRRNELHPSAEALCSFPSYKSNAGITAIYNPGSQKAVKWSKQTVNSLNRASETEMQFLAPEGGLGRAIPPCTHSCRTPFVLPAHRPAFRAGKSFLWLWRLPYPPEQTRCMERSHRVGNYAAKIPVPGSSFLWPPLLHHWAQHVWGHTSHKAWHHFPLYLHPCLCAI